MSNTIELLEAIGRDASLRHSSREDLSQALSGMDASAGLRMAAASGDSSHLAAELGSKTNTVNQNGNQSGNNGGFEPDEEDLESEPHPDGDE